MEAEVIICLKQEKRVSWFFESSQNDKSEDENQQQEQQQPPAQELQQQQNQSLQEQLSDGTQKIEIYQYQPPLEQQGNRTRKVSFIPSLSNRQEQQLTPPKLSVIQEEQPSSRKDDVIIKQVPANSFKSIQKLPQQSRVSTPSEMVFRTPKQQMLMDESSKQQQIASVKSTEFDINRELSQILQLIEINEVTFKKISTHEEVEIQKIADLFQSKISKLQKRLIQLNEIEQKQLDTKINANQKINLQEQSQKEVIEIEQQKLKQSSLNIRESLVNCLGYRVEKLCFEKKQYQLTFSYAQVKIQYSFSNQNQSDRQNEISKLFQEFQADLNQNQLMLTGLKIDYFQRQEFPKEEILQNSLKLKFQNSSKISNEIIFSAIHQMPLLLKRIDELELELTSAQKLWGIAWKFDPENNSIALLVGHRCKIDDKNLQQNSNKKVLRFQLTLKHFVIQYHYCQYFDELIFPFQTKESKKKRSNPEISFGERVITKIRNEYTELIENFLLSKPTLLELIDWLNIQQFS